MHLVNAIIALSGEKWLKGYGKLPVRPQKFQIVFTHSELHRSSSRPMRRSTLW